MSFARSSHSCVAGMCIPAVFEVLGVCVGHLEYGKKVGVGYMLITGKFCKVLPFCCGKVGGVV